MIWFFLLLTLSFYGSDHRISQSARYRHESMLLYFQQEESKKEAVSFWNRKYMFDNWSHYRNKLADLGVTVDSSFVTDMQGNPSGGKSQGFAYAGSYALSLNIDFTQAGLSDFHLFTSAVWRTGTNLSRDKIDNQFTVSQLYGSQTVRLDCLYLLKYFLDKRLSFKAGRLNAGDDFLCSPLYWQYVNNGFDGNPVSIFFNVPFTAYPKATWGAYAQGKPWEWLSIKAAVYNANSKIQANKYHGTNFTFASTNGVVWITEWQALVNQGKESHGLPGNYKVGFYYLTGSTHKFSGGFEKGDPGFYLLLDQMIYRKGGPSSDQGLTPFVSLISQPKDRNKFPFFVNGGLVYKGIIPGRTQDTASFGFVYGKYSEDLARAERAQGKQGPTAETVLELDYWVQITPWFYIMPDIQYIIRPKGLNTPNALVLGVQIGLDQW